MSQFPAKCSPPAKTSLPLRLQRHPRVGRGEKEGDRGPQTRHAEPARLPKAPPLLGNRALLCDTPHTQTHTLRTHRRAEVWSLHLLSTPKARDESDPWKIKIDESRENKTARKSYSKGDVEGGKGRGSCLGTLKCQIQFPDSFSHEEGASVPRGPPTGRMHCGPRWAAAPEERLVLLLRSELSPSERAFWWGAPGVPGCGCQSP